MTRCNLLSRNPIPRLGPPLLLIAIAWHHTFIHMWHRWFPAWQQTHLSLADRLMAGETYYRHGPVVLLVSVLLAWRAHRKADAIDAPAPAPGDTAMGLGLLGTGAALHLLSTLLNIGFTSGFALVLTLLGMLLVMGGRAMLRLYGPAVALLLFMIPLPLVWIAQLNFTLKMFAAGVSADMVQAITGSMATIDGSRVVIMGASGLPESLSIDSACSGLRSLIALTWFAAVLTVLCRLRGRWRWAMLALAVPTAIACNVLRIAVLIAGAQEFGVQAVAEDTPLHALAGLGAFAAALGIMLTFERGALMLGGGQGKASSQRQSSQRAVVSGVPRRAVLVLLVIVAAGSLRLGQPHTAAGAAASQASRPMPDSLMIRGAAWYGRDLAIPDSLRAVLGTSDIVHRRFVSPAGRGVGQRAIDLIVVHSDHHRQALHPPVVCLEADGHRVLAQDDCLLTRPDGEAITLRRLITQRGETQYVHLYAYRTDAGYTTSYLHQQWAAAFAGTPAALIRITVRGPDAEALTREAARLVLP